MKASKVPHSFYYVQEKKYKICNGELVKDEEGKKVEIKGYPLITVCVGQHPTTKKYSRGYAVCSLSEFVRFEDKPARGCVKEIGRGFALARMLRANGKQKSGEGLKNADAIVLVKSLLSKDHTPDVFADMFVYHSAWDVEVSEFERDLLDAAMERYLARIAKEQE